MNNTQLLCSCGCSVGDPVLGCALARIAWSTREVLDVDIQAVLQEIPVFSKVHLAEWGGGIEFVSHDDAQTSFCA